MNSHAFLHSGILCWKGLKDNGRLKFSHRAAAHDDSTRYESESRLASSILSCTCARPLIFFLSILSCCRASLESRHAPGKSSPSRFHSKAQQHNYYHAKRYNNKSDDSDMSPSEFASLHNASRVLYFDGISRESPRLRPIIRAGIWKIWTSNQPLE